MTPAVAELLDTIRASHGRARVHEARVERIAVNLAHPIDDPIRVGLGNPPPREHLKVVVSAYVAGLVKAYAGKHGLAIAEAHRHLLVAGLDALQVSGVRCQVSGVKLGTVPFLDT
jgi:hypothetical protein